MQGDWLYEHKVQYYETDMMGIVHHSNYIRWFEEARVEFLKDLGFSYKEMEARGVISPILYVACSYKSSSSFDDIIKVRIRIEKLGAYKLYLKYELFNSESGVILVLGETQQGFLDLEGKPVSLKKTEPALYKALEERVAQDNV